jgi:hypothetical protein
MKEFQLQSDKELEENVDILDGMSFKSWGKAPPALPQFQIGFITHVVVPLYITSASAGLADMTRPLTNLRDNLAKWQAVVAAGKEEEEEK